MKFALLIALALALPGCKNTGVLKADMILKRVAAD